ncbi:MAG: NfeD family protein [bacterium]
MEVLGIEIWILWGVATVVFFIAEIFVPSFFLAPMGIGAAAAAFSCLFTDSFDMQLAVFAAVTVLSFAVLRVFFKKYIYSETDSIKTNTDAMSGRVVEVTKTVGPGTSTGKVKIGSETWRAVSEDGESFQKGKNAVIVKTEGAKVIISGKDTTS